jgi:signal transduction histidine kinase
MRFITMAPRGAGAGKSVRIKGAGPSGYCRMQVWIHWLFFAAASIVASLLIGCARAADGREKTFWRLWAAGVILWGLRPGLASVASVGLVATFLQEALLVVALALPLASLSLYPEARVDDLREPVARLNASLMVLCLLYLYSFFVLPWEFELDVPAVARSAVIRLQLGEAVFLVGWMGARALLRQGLWSRIYLSFSFSTLLLFLLGPRWMLEHRTTAAAVGELVGVAVLGLTARATRKARKAYREEAHTPVARLGWPTALAAVGILLLGGGSTLWSSAPEPVRFFRLFATLEAIVVAVALIFLSHEEADRQGELFVQRLQNALADRQQWQQQLAQSEKLASLGQLAAGAAHEISNPVAAILGYAQLIADEPTGTEYDRDLAKKIALQAQRIRRLVENMVNFVQSGEAATEVVFLPSAVQRAMELRALAAGRTQLPVRMVEEAASLQVLATREALFQVLYRLFSLIGVEGTAEPARIRLVEEDGMAVVEIHGKELAGGSTASGGLLERGVSLSLDLCRKIVRQFGGDLSVQRHAGGAVTFRLSLQKASVQTSVTPGEQQPIPAAG